MIQEDKELLLKDLCARLPYGVKIELIPIIKGKCTVLTPILLRDYFISDNVNYLPYLRPMSSMTEEETSTLFKILNINENNETEWLKINDIGVIRLFTQEGKDFYEIAEAMDYLYSIHIDYRGLIERGLALVAPDGMYKINKK